jgi:hypothetical protein
LQFLRFSGLCRLFGVSNPFSLSQIFDLPSSWRAISSSVVMFNFFNVSKRTFRLRARTPAAIHFRLDRTTPFRFDSFPFLFHGAFPWLAALPGNPSSTFSTCERNRPWPSFRHTTEAANRHRRHRRRHNADDAGADAIHHHHPRNKKHDYYNLENP